MKRHFLQCAALSLGVAVCTVPETTWAAGEVLTVEAVNGQASVDRLGAVSSLKIGDHLAERDVIRVADGGSLAVDFSGHGFLELGPGAELGIEKLPFASYADELKSIFSLRHGYLRVVWKLSPLAGDWPLFIYFGNQHATLSPGEYFFDSEPGVARACVSAGHLAAMPNAGSDMRRLASSACYRFVGNLPPEKSGREASAWIAVRHHFDLDAPTSPEALLAEGDPDSIAAAAAAVPVVAQSALAPPAAPAQRPLQLKSSAPTAQMGRLAPPGAPLELPAPAPVAPVAAPPPAAVPPAMPPTASGGEWGVNIASYPQADDAARHVQQLHGAGFVAVVQPAQVKGATWYRVQLQGYPSADTARAAAAAVEAKLGYKGLWVTHSGAGGKSGP